MYCLWMILDILPSSASLFFNCNVKWNIIFIYCPFSYHIYQKKNSLKDRQNVSRPIEISVSHMTTEILWQQCHLCYWGTLTKVITDGTKKKLICKSFGAKGSGFVTFMLRHLWHWDITEILKVFGNDWLRVNNERNFQTISLYPRTAPPLGITIHLKVGKLYINEVDQLFWKVVLFFKGETNNFTEGAAVA